MSEIELLKLIASISAMHLVFDMYKDIRIHVERMCNNE